LTVYRKQKCIQSVFKQKYPSNKYTCLVEPVGAKLDTVIDTAFLGRVGEVEPGASALAGIIYRFSEIHVSLQS